MTGRLRNRLPRAVAVLGLAIYILGTFLSLALGHPELFQRFGALGVAAAILFFTDRLTQIELTRQRAVEALLHEYGLRFEALHAGIRPEEIPEAGYTLDFLAEESAFTRLRRKAEAISAGNTGLLSVATLQWGFGDLAVRALL
ncbi:hypothetical protein PVW48_04090 [Dinoroseobacter sp. PD6]|uniref:hypothetical protein n=1 Tax=Dinoroseobacter sp. PD6 TaxID=3028384 RepID=UPI00237B7A39|nr:hypothetical protein [Dinoroseobacter sp. PD6]MDD9715908.1 hypothetical protein [Dinoroseobacter sp. PD6]